MDSIAIINGKEQSNVSIFNRNFQYGDGLFETCIVKDNRILFWEKHLSRLEIGCRKLKIKNIEESLWLKDIKKALNLTSKKNCVLKLVLSRGNTERGYSYPDDILPVRVVIVSELKKTHTRDSYSLEYAQSGFHSNPMLDENQNIISVTQGNIYFIFGQRLVTPSLDRCGVIGSRRSLILELAETIELHVEQRNISINEVKKADEIFISNSIIGIQSVNLIEDFQFQKRSLTERIKIAFESVTQDSKSWTCI